MSFRVPPTSKYVQMAAAGRASGVWYRQEHTFYFQMPPGITKASMELSGIPAIMNLTLTCPNVQVALLAGEIMTTIMKVLDIRWKENFQGATEYDQALPITHFGDSTPDYKIIIQPDQGQYLNPDTTALPLTGPAATVGHLPDRQLPIKICILCQKYTKK